MDRRFQSQWHRFGAKPYRARRSPNTDPAMLRFYALCLAAAAIELPIAVYLAGGLRILG